MGTDRLIVEAAVARLWRVFPTRLFYWRKEGRFDSDEKEKANRGNTHYYRLTTLDALHAGWSRGFSPDLPLPTAAQMLASPGHGLLRSDEVMAMAGKTRNQIKYGVRDRYLPFLEIAPGRVLRFPTDTLQRVIARDNELVSQDMARRLLLLEGENAIDNLGLSGRLERVHQKGVREWMVDNSSLNALLQEQLGGMMDVEEWRSRTLAETRPPLTRRQVSLRYRIAAETLDAAVAKGRLVGITTAGGWLMLPQWALDEFFAWPAHKVAALLGVSTDVATTWIMRKALCNIRHGSTKSTCPSPRCLRTYVTENRTNSSFDANEWFTRSMRDGATPILGSGLLYETVRAEQIDITEALHNGTLRGVWLPPTDDNASDVAIMRSDAVAWRRVRERQLRQEYE